MSLRKIFFSLVLIPCLESYIMSHMNNEDDSNEIITQGKIQYQLLRERGNLPKYGRCWRAAVEAVDEGCRELSEETQSDIALNLANCFLEMSGLETYHCDMDKKENVRRICISSMTDRAFNVYTEFYSHTLNMCWFLRGQIWQETISDNTLKVGKQLQSSAAKQEKLLEIQQESLEIQEKMLHHGKTIENILGELSLATQNQQELLMLMGQTINNLQSWLVGEVSWVNTLIFYISFGVFLIILTSTPRTMGSRLPILTMMILNIIVERLICAVILSNSDFKRSAEDLYGDINDCIKFLRFSFVIVSFLLLIYKSWFYEDTLSVSKAILDVIHRQNKVILEKLDNSNSLPDKTYLVYKSNVVRNNLMNYCEDRIEDENSDYVKKVTGYDYVVNKSTPTKILKYNLRSRQNTPDN